MARFAWDCLQKVPQVTSALEPLLGPDTAELSIRVGLHSGQVVCMDRPTICFFVLSGASCVFFFALENYQLDGRRPAFYVEIRGGSSFSVTV